MDMLTFLSFIDNSKEDVVLFRIAEEYNLEKPQHHVPHRQQQRLRDELAHKLFLLRVEAGFQTTRDFARAAKVSINAIGTLEQGQWTEKNITVLTLHKIAIALSMALVIKINDEERYLTVTMPLEEIHAMGASITFSREG